MIQNKASGQDTIWVKEENKKYMVQGHGEWLFKDNLPDGHYCSYDYGDKKFPSVEVSFVNEKKEGIENRYYSYSKEKYAVVNWHNGKKNGIETHYNGNRTIRHILTFKNNTLDGYFVINWSEGERNYKGFYKNGYRDSIWTYYETGNKFRDTSDYWISKQYHYRNGKRYLISAWNKNGLQTLTNGIGTFTDSSYYKTVTTYFNGMKNGKQSTTKPDGTTGNERIYKDDLLINEIEYYDSNQVANISEWSYPLPAKIDTAEEWIDTYITDIFYNAISYEFSPVRNGHWLAYYHNRKIIYVGNYNDGKRIGTWNWNYLNGKQRIAVDYSKNTWQHFDTTGKSISNFTGEYLTDLTNGSWFLNQKLEDKTITLSKRNKQTVTPRFVFHFDGQLEINSFLECGKDIGESLNSYTLLADTLVISIPNEKTKTTKTYKYQIISAADGQITMKLIE